MANTEDITREVQELTFFRSPLNTTWYSLLVAKDFLVSASITTIKHKLFLFLALPVAIVWTALANVEGPHTETVEDATLWLRFTVWWFTLGVLSSIGLGSGMHTGLIFTFPHILKVVYTAEKCNSVDFETRTDIWGQIPTGELELPCVPVVGGEPPSFYQLWAKVVVACVIWGVGTAAGEIPPYQFAYMAAVAGEKNKEYEDEIAEAESSEASQSFATKQFNTMKLWMVDFIQRRGFLGVYLMSAWPNAAFDLCGMCCGSFKMPFWTFFGGTVLGKGFTLRPIQTAVLVALFSQRYRDQVFLFIGSYVPVVGTQVAEFGTKKLNSYIGSLEGDADGIEPEKGIGGMIWGGIVMLLVLSFLKSAFENFAQDYLRDTLTSARKEKRSD